MPPPETPFDHIPATPRMAAICVMAKMALTDGQVATTERQLLAQMLAESQSSLKVDQILNFAKSQTLQALTRPVTKYEDRFFITMRAYAMAQIDGVFDVREESTFSKLVALLDILPQDRQIIEETQTQAHQIDPPQPNPRLYELYKNSSFYCGS